MNSRERVLAALRRESPDRIPHCELGIDRALAQPLMGWGPPIDQAASLEVQPYTVEEAKALSAFLGLDNIYYVLRAPIYAQKVPGQDGRLFYGAGMIHSEADLALLQLPDPNDEALYEGAAAFAAQKGDFAAWFVTRAGIFPTMLSMGTETFSIALFENRRLVETILDTYVDWTCAVADRACKLGFDVFVTTDDMAFKTSTYFSPKMFRELVLPRYHRLARHVTLPWVLHSDGNMLPFLDDLVNVGIAGFHPVENGAMDIRAVKRQYGDRLCLLGNVDLNLLGLGTPEEVDAEVRGLIADVGPAGYIVTSGNSLAGYLKPECVLAKSEAVRKYG